MSQTKSSPQKPSGFAGFLERMRENRRQVKARNAGKVPKAAVAEVRAQARSATVAPALHSAVKDESSPVAAELKRYAYVRWLLRVLLASVILNAVFVLILFLTGLVAGQRPTIQITARPSLRAEAEAMFGKDTEVNVDDLLLYLNTVLPLMHRLDDRGAPELPLLRGLIAPQEYEKASAEANRSAVLAKKNFVVQNLVITRVDDVVTDNERGRVSAYVHGYLAIIVQSTNKPVILPYRAEVLLEIAPPSRLNRFPFVLIRREWRIAKAALAWDSTRFVAKPAHDSGQPQSPSSNKATP